VTDQPIPQQGHPSAEEKTEDENLGAISITGRVETNVLEDGDSEVIKDNQFQAEKDGSRISKIERGYPCLIVGLSSGRTLHAHHVTLYDETKLLELRALLVEMSGHLNRSTIELESPGGSIRAIAALSAQATPKGLAGIVSKQARSQATKLASSLPKKQQELQDSAVAVDIDRIVNIDMPYPNSWYCVVKPDASLEGNSDSWLTRLFHRNPRSVTHTDSAENEQRYVHDGDDFVLLEIESGFEYVRWSHVMTYRAEFGVR
jgi:hypothetical protein